ELKLRLRAELERMRQAPDWPPGLATRLRDSPPERDEGLTGTIHAFFAEQLRDRPIEPGAGPRCQVARADRAGVLVAHGVGRCVRLGGSHYDGLEAERVDLCKQRHWRWKGWFRANDGARKERRDRRDAVKARLDAFVRDAGAELAPMLRDELWPVVDEYERLK